MYILSLYSMKLSYHILLRVAILKFQQRIFITVNVWRQAFIFLLSALHSQTRLFSGVRMSSGYSQLKQGTYLIWLKKRS